MENKIKAQLNYIKETKELIRQAIINQGVDVPESSLFSDYPRLVASMGVVHEKPSTSLRDGAES